MKLSKYRILLMIALLMSFAPYALAQDTVELRVTWWGSQDRHDRTIQVIELYEAANPSVDISYEFSSFGDYFTRINTQAAGGQLACVIQHDYAFISEWQSRGLLVDLNPYIESGIIDTTNIPDALLAGGRIDGGTYGIALGTNSQSFMIDLDLLEQAGLEMPANDWTWADFEEYALQIHEELGIWALGPSLPDEAIWKSLYLGYDSWAFNDDGTALGYEDDGPLVDHFNMIIRLQDAGAVPTQEEAAEFASGPENAPIVTQLAAMDYRWSNQVVAVWSAAGEGRNFGLVPLPRPVDGVSSNYIKPSMFFSMTDQCPEELREEAAAFINFFINDIEANEVLFAERGVPISTVVSDHLKEMLLVLPFFVVSINHLSRRGNE